MMNDDQSTAYGARAIEAPSVRASTFSLEIISGPDVGRRHTIDASQVGRVYLGKSAASEIRLTDALVSRRHGALELAGTRLRYSDLESRNGIRVNGVSVVDAFLSNGDTLVVGESTLRVRVEAEGDALPVAPAVRFGRVVGASPEMRKLYPLAQRVARSDVPVIIEGETGTGKEVLAESIHEASSRSNGPFVVFDCTAVPPNLMESALFGHEKGAFTGAVGTRQGVFEQAHNGTLLIDEIGDLDLALQAKLLRAVERSEVQRVGGNTWIKVNVRVLSATRRDLEREIQDGRFRDDLFYRMAVARLELPPLRKRAGDITILTQHFWASLGGAQDELTTEVMRRFESYAWPGNVRELRNAIAHRIALGDMADHESLRRAPRSSSVRPGPGPGTLSSTDVVGRVLSQELPYIRARNVVLAEFDRKYAEWALDKYGGNVTRASAACGIARRYFYVIKERGNRNPGTDT